MEIGAQFVDRDFAIGNPVDLDRNFSRSPLCTAFDVRHLATRLQAKFGREARLAPFPADSERSEPHEVAVFGLSDH